MEAKYKCQYCGAPTNNDQSVEFASGLRIKVHRCDKCDKRWHQKLNWKCEGEAINENTIICPYCGHEYPEYRSYNFDEGSHEEIECEGCGRKFDLRVKMKRTFSTQRSLCEMPDDYGEDEE